MKTRKHVVLAKIKSYYSLIAVIAIFTSCSNDIDIPTPREKRSVKTDDVAQKKPLVNVVLKQTSLKALGYKSIDEMLLKGWTNEDIDDTKKILIKRTNPTTNGIQKKSQETIKEKITATQIEQLNLGLKKIKEIYKKSGQTPEWITINKWESSNFGLDSNTPNLADECECYAYIVTKKPTLTKAITNDAKDNITIDSFTITNNSDLDKSFYRTFIYTKSKTTSWAVTQTAPVTTKGKIGLPLVVEGEVPVSLSVTAGKVDTHKDETANTYTYLGKVPAHTKREIVIIQKKKTSELEYSIPLTFIGSVALNFPKPVDEHYYWTDSASKLLQGKKKEQLVSVSIEEVLDIEIMAGPAVKMDDF